MKKMIKIKRNTIAYFKKTLRVRNFKTIIGVWETK